MRKLASLLLALTFLLTLSSCSLKKDDFETDITYTVYNLGGSDMVSFYLTSDKEVYGVWEYDTATLTCLEINFVSDENTGDDDASRITLALKPIKAGKDTLSFSLSSGGSKIKPRTFNLEVTEENGNFKINITE